MQSAAIALFLGAGCVASVYAFCKCRVISPHQSLSRQTACSFLPTRGEAFLTLCEHGGRGKHGRYGKYHFVLWFAFAIRPHPSPSAPPSPSKGKASVGSANYIESASNFNPSINILQKNKFTLKEVSQNEKVTHHSLPLRGGRCRRRRRMRVDCKSKPQHKMIFALFAQCKEGFPSGGSLPLVLQAI